MMGVSLAGASVMAQSEILTGADGGRRHLRRIAVSCGLREELPEDHEGPHLRVRVRNEDEGRLLTEGRCGERLRLPEARGMSAALPIWVR